MAASVRLLCEQQDDHGVRVSIMAKADGMEFEVGEIFVEHDGDILIGVNREDEAYAGQVRVRVS